MNKQFLITAVTILIVMFSSCAKEETIEPINKEGEKHRLYTGIGEEKTEVSSIDDFDGYN